MMDKSAFPMPWHPEMGCSLTEHISIGAAGGLTRRELFAATNHAALLHWAEYSHDPIAAARAAVEHADAIIAALEKDA